MQGKDHIIISILSSVLQQTKQRLPALTLNKQDFLFFCFEQWRFLIVLIASGKDLLRTEERWQSNAVPWRKKCLDRLGWGIRLKPYQETEGTAVLDTYAAHKYLCKDVYADTFMHSSHTHTHATLKLSLVYRCLRVRFCSESSASTGWAQEKPRRPTPSNHNLTSPALPDRWRRPHVSFSLHMLLICAYVWTQPL